MENDIIDIAKKIVKCEPAYYAQYYYENNHVNIFLTHLQMSDIKLIIHDDQFYYDKNIIINIDESNGSLESLDIIIKSGKYHDKGFGLDSITDADNVKITFKCNNIIKRLNITQKLCTEDIYSYYGNQDGYAVGEINIKYNIQMINEIQFNGTMNIKGTNDGDVLAMIIN